MIEAVEPAGPDYFREQLRASNKCQFASTRANAPVWEVVFAHIRHTYPR